MKICKCYVSKPFTTEEKNNERRLWNGINCYILYINDSMKNTFCICKATLSYEV